ncbi:hypothetical protein E4U14_004813 [Claviceps sp. LM454 group G7]|nr:hypothetical protein E4U14_004813 [Claviceps sp. LM454 group G7]
MPARLASPPASQPGGDTSDGPILLIDGLTPQDSSPSTTPQDNPPTPDEHRQDPPIKERHTSRLPYRSTRGLYPDNTIQRYGHNLIIAAVGALMNAEEYTEQDEDVPREAWQEPFNIIPQHALDEETVQIFGNRDIDLAGSWVIHIGRYAVGPERGLTPAPVLVQVHGAGGTGKSFLIHAVSDVLLTKLRGSVHHLPPSDVIGFKDALRIYRTNDQVNAYNRENLEKIEKPFINIAYSSTGRESNKAASRDAGNPQQQLSLCVGAKVVLTENPWTAKGLVNGAIGTVVDFVWKDGTAASDLRQVAPTVLL